jgi:DNA-binding Lrp family transcriptional regulator
MRRAKLDRIDKKILRDLQEDGRISNVDLAKRVGISAPPCLRRVRALEEGGYIHSYHAKVNPVTLGYNVTVFAMVKLESQSETELGGFEKMLQEQPLVRECHLLAGDTDFLLKIVAKDWDSYQNFHSNVLTKVPGVTSVKSSLAIRSSKDEVGVPIED